MLSRIDIEKYIGNGIYIVPFTRDNIKENSINLKLSNKAWTLKPSKNGMRQYDQASSACNKNIITLVPHATTVVYTEEVIALNSKFGGTFHAKVGVVSKGIVFGTDGYAFGCFGRDGYWYGWSDRWNAETVSLSG